MAVDKLVDSTKLDACLNAEADAIRAKTGGSADIPFDYANNKGFADAIAAIPSGGGGSALIASYTASEPVNAARIDFTNEMLGYDLYFIVVSGTPSRAEYLCPAVNAEPSTSTYSYVLTANTAFKQAFILGKFNLALAGYYLLRFYTGVQNTAVSEPLGYFKVAGYYTDTLFTDMKIDIYGVNAS